VRIATVVVIVGRRRRQRPRLRPPAHGNLSPVDNYNCCIRLPPLNRRQLVRIRSRPPRASRSGGGSSADRQSLSQITTVRRRRAPRTSLVLAAVRSAPLSLAVISIIIMCRFKVSADAQTTQ